ncbi:3-beta hydroxysteroid dehydrogenase [Dyadobacter beijingensis]|uniref:3-beta hydroxysteroid dehydrogenase n=1 Tax=Dyadobacter beijingensis TaxID=365489 RepID=A0ABQ2IL18_9BACT|nr:SDR family oxidoreductase [Dyadobacter beijingensis]GGN12011.1 3-beta hydroxysteroid dehydrogenase [Dyadobacter beijingensis]
MHVFVTGASGFVGSAIVEELVKNGHQVTGLVRTESGADKVAAAGAAPHLGDVNDLDMLRERAGAADAVIHTAFNHDFSNFKASCEADRKVVEAMGDAVAGTGKPLVITTGLGLLRYDRTVTEDDALNVSSDTIPRSATDEAAKAAADRGADVYIVRLPPSVHGAGDHGFIPIVINMARENGESAYITEGQNRWPAVHRLDAAILYRLIIEQRPSLKTLHAVAEEGIPFRNIAEVIGNGLHLPVVSKSGDNVKAHFGWFEHFAAMDCAASSEKTRQILGWDTTAPGLLSDIAHAGYLIVS